MHPCMHASMYPCIHTRMHTCMHAYIQTYIYDILFLELHSLWTGGSGWISVWDPPGIWDINGGRENPWKFIRISFQIQLRNPAWVSDSRVGPGIDLPWMMLRNWSAGPEVGQPPTVFHAAGWWIQRISTMFSNSGTTIQHWIWPLLRIYVSIQHNLAAWISLELEKWG